MMIVCDFELADIDKVQVGDWVQLADGEFSLIVADLPSAWEICVAEFDAQGQAHFVTWKKDGLRQVLKVSEPILKLGGPSAVTGSYYAWSTPIAITSEGPVLRIINPNGQGRGHFYYNLLNDTGTSSQPGSFAAVSSFSLWSSERARSEGDNPLVQFPPAP